MADDRTITPAPKPSARGKAVAKKDDDVKEGVVTFTEEQLTKDAKKRAELIAAKDGTPGKELAVLVQANIERDKAAAPIITAATKDAKAWDELHGKAAKVTRSLAEKLVQLRTLYLDAKGNPDMRGSSIDYREAAAKIYINAGFDEEKTDQIRGAVRYHASDVVRAALKGPDFANGDEKKYEELCGYYRLNPQSAMERQKEGRQAVRGGSQLPALRLNEDDAPGMFFGVAQYAHKALELPGDADPAVLPDDERKALREELTAVRDRADEILAALGDE